MALVELSRFITGHEAEIVRGRLEAEGIPAFCFDTGMNVVESAGIAINARVMVDDADLARARTILDAAFDDVGLDEDFEGWRTGEDGEA